MEQVYENEELEINLNSERNIINCNQVSPQK